MLRTVTARTSVRVARSRTSIEVPTRTFYFSSARLGSWITDGAEWLADVYRIYPKGVSNQSRIARRERGRAEGDSNSKRMVALCQCQGE